jgi:hypothetical protein
MKKLQYILIGVIISMIVLFSINATVYINDNALKICGKDSMVYGGSVCAKNVIQTDIYGFNSSFIEAYTILLTEDIFAKVTNAGDSLWDLNCGNGFTESGDTMICSLDGQWGGIFSLNVTGGSGDDYELRLYDVTAAAQVYDMIAYTSAQGVSNYVSIVLPVCMQSVNGHRYVWQIRNLTDNSDVNTVNGMCWFTLMKKTNC